MTEMPDSQLLEEFAKRGSATAFEQLVRRHMDWVYSCARRTLGDAHLAEDVAQAVFILLAAKARALQGHAQLGGWLFRATRYCAANAQREQNRRQRHEKEAPLMQTQTAPDEQANWEELYPVLDEAVTGLGGADRDAVLLRYYQGKTMAEVATALGIGDEAAKKRVQRAVEKLRAAMVKKGVCVSTGGLAVVMGAKITQAAPSWLVGAAVKASLGAAKTAAGSTMAAAIAKAAGKLMWGAKVKLAAMLVAGGGAGVVAVGVTVHALAAPATQPVEPLNQMTAGTGSEPITVMQGPLSALYNMAFGSGMARSLPSGPFDGLYEKAPASGPELSMKVGPNTFAVTAVARFGADGKAVATDGRGKLIETSTLPLQSIQPPARANTDVVVVFLQPGRERYDVDRLRVFDHQTRQYRSDVMVDYVPGLSALRLTAASGTLPEQIDLWLDVASYEAGGLVVILPAKSGATVAVGSAAVGFGELRDGAWNFDGKKYTPVDIGRPQTTMQLKATGKWNAGRYQISAVSKAGQKYLSDFFIDLSGGTGQTMTFPFALDQTDHFELRPLAHEPPFFFDGVTLPPVKLPAAGAGRISQPVIVAAGKESRVKLPCGAVVELAGIGYHPHTAQGWWGVDGLPVDLGNVKSGGSVSNSEGRYRLRELVARIVDAPADVSWLLWKFEPAGGWAGGGSERESSIAASLAGAGPVTVRVGVGATPWETLEEIGVEKLPAEAQFWPGWIAAPKATAEGLSLETGMLNLPGNVRMVLVDQTGKAQVQYRYSSSSEDKLAPWGHQRALLSWRGLRPEDVRSIRFETRREEYAAFENVPLEPK